VAQRLADEMLSLPVHPSLDDDDLQAIAGELSASLEGVA
jgi:dTDP-4-amino-4,6-dideoxygalactose transaminase